MTISEAARIRRQEALEKEAEVYDIYAKALSQEALAERLISMANHPSGWKPRQKQALLHEAAVRLNPELSD